LVSEFSNILNVFVFKEEFEHTKGVVRIRKSKKYRQKKKEEVQTKEKGRSTDKRKRTKGKTKIYKTYTKN
jgi:lipocalin